MESQTVLDVNQFRRDGYQVCDHVLAAHEVDRLLAALAAIPDGKAVRRKRIVYGVRNLLEICPAVRELATWPTLRQNTTHLKQDVRKLRRAPLVSARCVTTPWT